MIGSIQALRRRDIVHHRRGGVLPLEVVCLLVSLRKVTHDRTRFCILGVGRTRLVIGGTAVVVTRMMQADGVTNLMNGRDRKVAAQRR